MDKLKQQQEISKALEIIVDVIKQELNPLKVILFGSYAKKKYRENSDIDIFVIVESSNLPRYKRAIKIRQKLWGKLPPLNKDILVYTQKEVEEWKDVELSFVNAVLKEGVVLYER